MIRRLRSALTMACLASAAAHADYLVFKLGYDLVDLRAPTHFFLSGFQIKPDGKDSVGNLFFESGYSSAILARETLGAQVIFLAPVDKLHGKDAPFPLKRLMEMGNLGTRKLQLLARRSGDLNTGTAFGEMLNYQRIAGIHMYGHSSLFGGATLTYGHRINAFDASAQPLFRKIAERLAPDAFVTLNGCNTGYKQAPQWSALLKVPVRGTLTGTDFQELHANGQWYFHNPGQFPVGEWLTENAETYTPAIKRWEGGQVRMMPTNSLYNGSWGDFEGGLGFPKFFCNYDRGARRARNCEAAMARAAAIFPGRGASTSCAPRILKTFGARAAKKPCGPPRRRGIEFSVLSPAGRSGAIPSSAALKAAASTRNATIRSAS